MAQHKYQMSQAYYLTPKHNLGVSDINSNYTNVITPNKVSKQGQIRQLLGNLFIAFTKEDSIKNNSSWEEATIIKELSNNNTVENSAMRDLENCANAAREIGACGQSKLRHKRNEK